MLDIRTPGVYVEEISTFPASVVRVATAVPVFVGYTEAVPAEFLGKPVKIKSLGEYQEIFGGEPTTFGRSISVALDANANPIGVTLGLSFYLYHCLRHYFANGGGDAYILSIGTYVTAPSTDANRKTAMIAALPALEVADEPTLVLVPDAYAFALPADLGEVQSKVLAHCAKMQDRFGILDVKSAPAVSTAVSAFRSAVGSQNLKNGAAYFPPLNSTLGPDGFLDGNSFTVSPGSLESIATTPLDPVLLEYAEALDDLNRLKIPFLISGTSKNFLQWYDTTKAAITAAASLTLNAADTKTYLAVDVLTRMDGMAKFLRDLHAYTFKTDALETAKNTLVGTSGTLKSLVTAMYKVDIGYAEINTVFGARLSPPATAPAAVGIITPASYATPNYALAPALLTTPGDVTAAYGPVPTAPATTTEEAITRNAIASLQLQLDALKAAYNSLTALVTKSFETATAGSAILSGIVNAIRAQGYTLPPSGAIAGIYAAVDASRGVWKAPANVSLNAVNSVAKLTEDELNDLNIPSDGSGKAINALRFFRGQGNLVYGARTLAGNDNEWRYVPVRRLFIMVEESIKKATEPLVFEPNNAKTWLLVKGMIESFLNGIWRDGGLAGASPEDAYFVKVGLGQTMTAQDILDGKMIIEIGMAAVRPAEYIVLKFMHKLQES